MNDSEVTKKIRELEFPEPHSRAHWESLDKSTLAGRNWVFDLESNGLLPELDRVWLLVAIDADTLETFIFSDEDEQYIPLKEFTKIFDTAKVISGHHICQFDLAAMIKLGLWRRPKTVKPFDTLIVSKRLNYERFGSGFRHGLAHWGTFFGLEKPEHDEWDRFSPEMVVRCLTDTQINVMVYLYLLEEISQSDNRKMIGRGLKAEHGTSEYVGRSQVKGWFMDRPLMLSTREELEAEMESIKAKVEPELFPFVKLDDPEPKAPVFIKNGNYNAHTARWFKVDQEEGRGPAPIVRGNFTRLSYVTPEIGNQDSVKGFLRSKGWEPDEWNYKKVGRKFIKVSDKLTTSSLSKVEPWGPLVDRFFTLRARHSILKGWLEEMGDSDYLIGDMFVFGTPTGRATHKIVANIPSTDAAYGEEFRRMFTVPEGWAQVGADSSGCQVRALCHYLKNDEYTKEVISGDVHQLHTNIALEVTEEATRSKMKRVFFAMIFGAGGGKIGMYLSGVSDYALGTAVKDRLINRIGGFSQLIKKIEYNYNENLNDSGTKSWLPCIDGSKIFLESPHKGLNYLVQSCEAVTCKMATTLAMERLDEEIGVDNWAPLTFYHDEIQLQVKEEYAERAAEIARQCFIDGPKLFGIDFMDGEAKVGKNWFDCH